MKDLHPKQAKLLQLLQETVEEPLSMKALADRLDIATVSLVYHHIAQLEKKGYLKRDPNNPANYQILADEPEKQIAYLNLYGLAQCGPKGSILDDIPKQRIPISPSLLSFPSREAFLVEARGDSMLPSINEGDYVIARMAIDAKNGQTIVCVNNEEALIKKLVIGKDGKYWLTSTNPSKEYEAFEAADDFRVQGLVTGLLFRRLNNGVL